MTPGSGTASSLAMLNAIYLEHVLRRTPLRPVRGALVSGLNRAARALDRRSATLREPRPGTLAANYHVVARAGHVTRGPGNRRRRLHRLEPRRALLERGDDVRVLDNFSTGSRSEPRGARPRGRGRRGRPSVIRARAHGRPRHRRSSSTRVRSAPCRGRSRTRSPRPPSTSRARSTSFSPRATRASGVSSRPRPPPCTATAASFRVSRRQAPNPLSPYAVAKLAAERFCVSFTRVYGLETVALRYFNVFGPRQDPTSQYAAVVPRFITAIAAGRPVTMHGDGGQSRDFTYVENVVAREPARGGRQRARPDGSSTSRRAGRRPSTRSRRRSGGSSTGR